MTIVGLNFTKIDAERKKPIKGKVDIKNNIQFLSIEEAKIPVNEKRAALRFEFEYVAVYEPGMGHIRLIGEIVYLAERKAADDLLKLWKKEKKTNADFMSGIMNHILAIVVGKDINLPAPIPLPKVK